MAGEGPMMDPSQMQSPPQGQPQAPPVSPIQQKLQQIAQTPLQPVPPVGPDQPSPVRKFLTNFFYGMGQGALREVGLPTDYEKQQQTIANNQRQQQLNNSAQETSSLIGLHQQQSQLAAAQASRQADEEAFMPIGPQAAALTGLPAETQVRKKDFANILVTGLKGNTAENVAGTRADALLKSTGLRMDTSASNNAANNRARLTAQQMRDATSSGNVDKRLNAAAGAPGQPKPTVADRNRQSLAKIALDSLQDMEDVVKRRPEKIGMLAGRATNVEQMLGSNDPDVVAIGNAVHNFAMANAGIHGSRSHENVVDAENMLLNHMRNGPQGLMGGITVNKNNLNRIIGGGSVNPPPTSNGTPSAGGTAPEGFRVKMADGSTQVKRGGKWVPE